MIQSVERLLCDSWASCFRYQEEDKELEEMIAASGMYFRKKYVL